MTLGSASRFPSQALRLLRLVLILVRLLGLPEQLQYAGVVRRLALRRARQPGCRSRP